MGLFEYITQAKRDQVIRRFKEQTIDIMVATDVAARGLDISGQMAIPDEKSDYKRNQQRNIHCSG